MVCIADTGFLVALRGKPAERKWAQEEFERHGAPFYTCEAVLAEAAHFVDSRFLSRLIEEGDIVLHFSLREQQSRVRQLLEKYHGVMDITDACVVRLSEMFPQCLVFTVDKTDFSIYRRFGNQSIPLNTPPAV
jgi:predicted nucleic acid-binding protein